MTKSVHRGVRAAKRPVRVPIAKLLARARRLAADCGRWPERPHDLDRQTLLLIERSITWTLWFRRRARVDGGRLDLCCHMPATHNAPYARLVQE